MICSREIHTGYAEIRAGELVYKLRNFVMLGNVIVISALSMPAQAQGVSRYDDTSSMLSAIRFTIHFILYIAKQP
jgi:hypothetical protein